MCHNHPLLLLLLHDTKTMLLPAAATTENGDVEAPSERGMRVVAFAAGVSGDEDCDSEAALKKRLRSENVQDSMVIIRKQLSLRERHGEAEEAAAGEEEEEGEGAGPSSSTAGERHVRMMAP
jgi:hypothetical protein